MDGNGKSAVEAKLDLPAEDAASPKEQGEARQERDQVKKQGRDSSEPLFLQAVRIGLSQSILWEKEDLENLLAAVPRGSVGMQAVAVGGDFPWDISGVGIPRCFLDNKVRIVQWDFRNVDLSAEVLDHLQRCKNDLEGLRIAVSTAAELNVVQSMPNLRNLKLELAVDGFVQPSTYILPPSLRDAYFNGSRSNLAGNQIFRPVLCFRNVGSNLQSLDVTCCRIEGVDLTHCINLRKVNFASVRGLDVLKLPHSVQWLRLQCAPDVEIVECGHSMKRADIYWCNSLQSIQMRECDALESLELTFLPESVVIETPPGFENMIHEYC